MNEQKHEKLGIVQSLHLPADARILHTAGVPSPPDSVSPPSDELSPLPTLGEAGGSLANISAVHRRRPSSGLGSVGHVVTHSFCLYFQLNFHTFQKSVV